VPSTAASRFLFRLVSHFFIFFQKSKTFLFKTQMTDLSTLILSITASTASTPARYIALPELKILVALIISKDDRNRFNLSKSLKAVREAKEDPRVDLKELRKTLSKSQIATLKVDSQVKLPGTSGCTMTTNAVVVRLLLDTFLAPDIAHHSLEELVDANTEIAELTEQVAILSVVSH
jgi:hypothetical protein